MARSERNDEQSRVFLVIFRRNVPNLDALVIADAEHIAGIRRKVQTPHGGRVRFQRLRANPVLFLTLPHFYRVVVATAEQKLGVRPPFHEFHVLFKEIRKLLGFCVEFAGFLPVRGRSGRKRRKIRRKSRLFRSPKALSSCRDCRKPGKCRLGPMKGFLSRENTIKFNKFDKIR